MVEHQSDLDQKVLGIIKVKEIKRVSTRVMFQGLGRDLDQDLILGISSNQQKLVKCALIVVN